VNDQASTESAPSRPALGRPALLGTLVAGFLACAALDEAGVFSGIDQFAVSHLMPWLRPTAHPHDSIFIDAISPIGTLHPWYALLPGLWTYPCSVLISGLLLALLLWRCWRRGRPSPAVALIAVWVAGNALELVGKATLRRPALYGLSGGHRLHVTPFDGSFPSGHMLRGTIVAAVMIELAPHARGWWLGWWLLVGPALVVSAAHTPSDVLGGALAGLALVGSAQLLSRSALLERACARVADARGAGSGAPPARRPVEQHR
jgi:membrane-associated phospholipid phosphatase